jgi:hypothetical protein
LPSTITLSLVDDNEITCHKVSDFFPTVEEFEQKFAMFSGLKFADSKCFNAATSLAPVTALLFLVAALWILF